MIPIRNVKVLEQYKCRAEKWIIYIYTYKTYTYITIYKKYDAKNKTTQIFYRVQDPTLKGQTRCVCVCIHDGWFNLATASPAQSQSDWTLGLGEPAHLSHIEQSVCTGSTSCLPAHSKGFSQMARTPVSISNLCHEPVFQRHHPGSFVWRSPRNAT